MRGPVRAAVSRLPLRGAADREGGLVRDVAHGHEIPQVYQCAELGGGRIYVPISQELVERLVRSQVK
jgi:hypothetical protein